MCINRVRELDDNRGTKACNTFEKCRYANHRGLCPEKIALTGEQIRNFPQAFSDLSLMDAAKWLNEAPPTALGKAGGPNEAAEPVFSCRPECVPSGIGTRPR